MKNTLPSKEEILKTLLEHRKEIERYGIRKLGLFGSFVKNQQAPSSDIDILVEFAKGHKNFDNFINLATLLENLLNRKIDLVTKESLSPYIGPKILKETQYVIECT